MAEKSQEQKRPGLSNTCDFPNTEHLKPKTLGEAETEPIGTTSNHPFWSVDRQEFVQAWSLEIGERLQTLSGDVKVVQQKLPRPGPQPVFNLEVHNEHVYFFGEDGVLVHNSCDNVLVVGEAASLEYSIALARANPNMRVTATSLHGLSTVDGIRQNLRVIQHSVDATSLGKHFKGETFGSVVFNVAVHFLLETGV